jgi:hypothetical protein
MEDSITQVKLLEPVLNKAVDDLTEIWDYIIETWSEM